MDFLGETLEAEEVYEDSPAKKGRYSAKKRKEIFDYDEVNPQVDETEVLEEETDEEEPEEEESSHTSTGLIVTLTVLIAVLLLAAAFLFVRFILPSLRSGDGKEPAGIVQETQDTTGETELFIPCQYITLSSGGAVLNAEGQFFLLHVVPTPEDTTETIYYAVEDESIATVSEDGKLTAVSEGETTVYITCGNQQVTCPVTVKYEEETVPPTEATEATEAAAEDEPEATEAPVDPGLKNVTLKLKKTDIMLGIGYKVQLLLDCGLDQNEVEWSVEHEHIASVDEEGWVKALKYGTTSVTAKYGDQEVKCMVRCG